MGCGFGFYAKIVFMVALKSTTPLFPSLERRGEVKIMTKRVFLIHGWEGRPDNHWFPWLSWELKARGFEVEALSMPNPNTPNVEEWVKALKTSVGRLTADTYFVGHSLGCIAILRYFEKLPKASKAGGAVFVAGFSDDLDIPEIANFCLPPQTAARGQTQTTTRTDAEFFEKVKSHCPKFVTIFSDNDEYVPMEKSLEFQKALGAKGILERGKGHFSKSEGSTALPAVFKSIIEMQK